MELVKRGAEAVIYRDGDKIVKVRIKKSYRHPDLDIRIRLQRTRREARLIKRAREAGVNTPSIISVDENNYTIVMEYIEGERLKEYLYREKDVSIMEKLGEVVATLHNNRIIHGDLTTSNIILREGNIYLIDFGLGEISDSVEDKAVDLVCFKKSYMATHPDFEEGWKAFIHTYAEHSKDGMRVVERMEEVERRGRYL